MGKEEEKDEDFDEASLTEFKAHLHDRYEAPGMADEDASSSVRDCCMDLTTAIFEIAHMVRREFRQPAMADQLLRCGMSIGTNMAEAESAQSEEEYLRKCEITRMECLEARKWLEVFYSNRFYALFQLEPIMAKCDHIRERLDAICRTDRKGAAAK